MIDQPRSDWGQKWERPKNSTAERHTVQNRSDRGRKTKVFNWTLERKQERERGMWTSKEPRKTTKLHLFMTESSQELTKWLRISWSRFSHEERKMCEDLERKLTAATTGSGSGSESGSWLYLPTWQQAKRIHVQTFHNGPRPDQIRPDQTREHEQSSKTVGKASAHQINKRK